MAIERFRSLPLKDKPAQVDREAKVIRGVSCAQAVEALGHGMALDDTSIQQLVTLGNSAKQGVKSRFTHPGLSSDGLGKMLGRLKNFRQEADKAVADLHLSSLAFKSPSGNLGEYVMDMAEQEPESFGMSVVIDTKRVWPLDSGMEIEAGSMEDRPANSTTQIPVARIHNFVACDAVDEPAANRDGIFSSALWATNTLAEGVFGDIDNYLADMGISSEKAFAFALKYFNARGVDLKEFKPMEEQQGTLLEATGPAAEDVAKLQAQVDEMKAALAAKEQAEQARQKELADATERIAKMEKEAQDARFRALSASWVGNPALHLGVLAQLGEGSELFKQYVEQQNAISAQLNASELLKETGSSREGTAQTAQQQLDRIAREMMSAEPKLTYAVAFARAVDANPKLYEQHKGE